MDYKSKLITLREERNLTKSALYGGICSKGKYLSLEDESSTTSVTIPEMTAILERLGLSWSEFIEYTDLSGKTNVDYGRLKLELLEIAQSLNDQDFVKKLTNFLNKIRPQKFDSSQLFTIYLATVHFCVIQEIPVSYNSEELFNFALDLFKDRSEFYVVDYEIIANIPPLIEINQLITLANYLYPCQLNRGYYHDDIAQMATINIIEYLIKSKKYILADEWIDKTRKLIDSPGFIRNALTTLKLLYLKEEVAFRSTKDMRHYSELLRYADLFKEMNEMVIHKAIFKDTLHQISKEYDIETPGTHLLYQQHYVDQLDHIEDKIDYDQLS